jgi:hypothetical protein
MSESDSRVWFVDRDFTLQSQLDRNVLQLPYLQRLSYAPNAHSRYDDIPEYPGRFRGWYSHIEKSPSPSSSPILVPTAPASPILPPTTQVSPFSIYNIEDVQLTALIASVSNNKDEAVQLNDKQTEREKQVCSPFFRHLVILILL